MMIKRRCCRCGKISNNKTGEYIRKDRTCGYINYEEGETQPVCTDCREKELDNEPNAKGE